MGKLRGGQAAGWASCGVGKLRGGQAAGWACCGVGKLRGGHANTSLENESFSLLSE